MSAARWVESPFTWLLLVGLGLRQLSMPSHQLPEIKRLIRGLRIEAAREVAAEVLGMKTAQEVVERRLTVRAAAKYRLNEMTDHPIRPE